MGMISIKDSKSAEVNLVSSRSLWQGAIMGICEDELILPGTKSTIVRQYTDHPGAVGILALRQGVRAGSNQILLIEQYRHPVRSRLWEIPAGLLDVAGESAVDAAKRELLEETDLRADRWDVLVDHFNSPGSSNESMRIFLARGISAVAEAFPRTDEEKGMRAVWVDLEVAVKLVLGGSVHNPSAIIGILTVFAAQTGQWQDLRPVDSPWFR